MADFFITEGTTSCEEKSGEATISVTVNLTVDKDAPPARARAVAEAVGKVLILSLPEEICDEIGRYLQETSERKRREVDLNNADLPTPFDAPMSFDGDLKL